MNYKIRRCEDDRRSPDYGMCHDTIDIKFDTIVFDDDLKHAIELLSKLRDLYKLPKIED